MYWLLSFLSEFYNNMYRFTIAMCRRISHMLKRSTNTIGTWLSICLMERDCKYIRLVTLSQQQTLFESIDCST